MGVIGFRKAKCKDCYKCVRLCEVKAIRIKDEHAQFVASECVECGKCEQHCPQGIAVRKELKQVVRHMENPVYKVIAFFAKDMFKK